MISKHARFESLSGAIALGEATLVEREEFARHAAGCSLCAGEPFDAGLLAAIAAERDGETWRPSVDRRVVARIREAQSNRSRLTVGLLGWAAAASIAVNVFFVTGFAGRIGSAALYALTPQTDVASAQFGVRLPAQTFATVQRNTVAQRALVQTAALGTHRTAARVVRRRHTASALVPLRGPVQHDPPVVDPPDVFAGTDLAVRDDRAPRAVAVETHPLQFSP